MSGWPFAEGDGHSTSIAEQFSTSGKEREGGDVLSPSVPPGGTKLADPDLPTPAKPGEGRYPDRAQRRRGRKAPARPATRDRGEVYRSAIGRAESSGYGGETNPRGGSLGGARRRPGAGRFSAGSGRRDPRAG